MDPSPSTVVFLPSTSLVLASFNCFTLTASVSFSPAFTLVMFLLPASIPVLVTDGPPVIVIPSLLITVSPIVKEPSLVKSTSLSNANSTEAPLAVSACFTVKFLPACISTVLASEMFVAVVIPLFLPSVAEDLMFQLEAVPPVAVAFTV